jgi:hypothetical protein
MISATTMNLANNKDSNMANCLDITNLTTPQLEQLLNDILAEDMTFDEAIEIVGGYTINIEDEKE